MQVSGNHGRSSAEPPPTGLNNLVPSTTPQQSTRGFVAPSSMPIKKTPDITDIIGEGRREKEEGDGGTTAAEHGEGRREKEEGDGGTTAAEHGRREKGEGRKEAEELSPSNFEGVSEGRGSLYEDKPAEAKPQPNKGDDDGDATAAEHGRGSLHEGWHTMFERVFASVPTIYIPLKETLPKIENNIITVTVKNDVQKEHFEAKIREVLEFLRTHFNERIEDIVVETNELLETKKIIYDVKDKLQNFKEQNAEFEDFLQILDLKIKD